MPTLLRFFLLLLALATFPAFAQNFTLNTPKGWTLEWDSGKNGKAAPKAQLTSDSELLSASLGIAEGLDVSGFNNEQLQKVVLGMAEGFLPNAVETKPVIKPFGVSNSGMYLRLTDKDSQTQLRYVTFAIHRKGKDLALGAFFSNDGDGRLLPKFLGVVESVVVVGSSATPTVGGSAKGQPSPPAPATEDTVWGAIASDAAKGESDPYYGIGGGATPAEAEKNALKFCREAGAKRCTARLTYTQCGAYALSESGPGTGKGATKREAEKLALSACKYRDCEIVASDCN